MKETQASIKLNYKVGIALIKSTKTRVVVNARRHNFMKSSSVDYKVDVGMSPSIPLFWCFLLLQSILYNSVLLVIYYAHFTSTPATRPKNIRKREVPKIVFSPSSSFSFSRSRANLTPRLLLTLLSSAVAPYIQATCIFQCSSKICITIIYFLQTALRRALAT